MAHLCNINDDIGRFINSFSNGSPVYQQSGGWILKLPTVYGVLTLRLVPAEGTDDGGNWTVTLGENGDQNAMTFCALSDLMAYIFIQGYVKRQESEDAARKAMANNVISRWIDALVESGKGRLINVETDRQKGRWDVNMPLPNENCMPVWFSLYVNSGKYSISFSGTLDSGIPIETIDDIIVAFFRYGRTAGTLDTKHELRRFLGLERQ